jgi:predicted cupin superfamily sugar epimerase
MDDVDEIVETLGLRAHPEGGLFVETWRGGDGSDGREAGSAIYYLLRPGEQSAWHRVDAAEIWHHYAGAALRLSVAASSGLEPARRLVLGDDISAGQRPQVIVAPGEWQSAMTLGAWTLVGCTVSPAFRFEGFELGPPGWQPGGRSGEG